MAPSLAGRTTKPAPRAARIGCTALVPGGRQESAIGAITGGGGGSSMAGRGRGRQACAPPHSDATPVPMRCATEQRPACGGSARRPTVDPFGCRDDRALPAGLQGAVVNVDALDEVDQLGLLGPAIPVGPEPDPPLKRISKSR